MANQASKSTTKKANSGNRSRSNSNRSGSSSSKKNTTGKNSPKKGTKAYERARAEERMEAKMPPERMREIYLFVFLAFNLILVLGTYGVCGFVGKAVSGFFFGIFGGTFYVLPFFFFAAAGLILANGPRIKLIKKLIWIFVVFMMVGFILQLIQGTSNANISSLYLDGYRDHLGGGILFGGISVLISKLIGRVGVVIIIVLVLFIALIAITNISIIDAFKTILNFNFHNVESFDDAEYEGDEDYDEDYDEEEEEEARALIEKRKTKGGKSILNGIRILDAKPIPTKKTVSKKENKIVHGEEMEELIPKPDTSRIKTANSVPKAVDEISLPGENRGRRSTMDPQAEQNQLLDEFSSTSAFYNSGKTDKTITRTPKSDKPKDFFELTPESTYKDYSSDIGSHTEEFPIYDENNLNPESPEKSSDDTIISTKAKPAVSKPAPEEKVTKDDKLEATTAIDKDIAKTTGVKKKKYVFPPVKLLKSGGNGAYNKKNDDTVVETAKKLKSTLESFGVNVTITNCSVGPSVTRYEMQPEVGVKVSKIVGLADDIKLNLAAEDIRIEAPIPGKAAIGIEVPNKENTTVYFRDLIDSDKFKKFKSNLVFAVGKDIGGALVITDIAKMPHLLIAGATGSGKSVCINTIIMSLLYKSTPDDVRMILIDPKMVELSAYNGIPHLLIPVVTDPKKAAGALNWAVNEMTKRYKLFNEFSVRNIHGFNKKVEENPNASDNPEYKHMPHLIVIVDELADLMMVAHGEVEDSIVRLSQLARAAGIHLVIATQRPSVDVITGLIKANVPSRIAFSVASGVDSRTILDMVGAEKLLGRGDMLFYPSGYTKPVRVQGALISDDEVNDVTDFIRQHYGETTYDDTISDSIASSSPQAGGGSIDSGDDNKYDELFEEAGRIVIEKDKASIGYLQRVLRIGFNRAARIMDQLSDAGVVGPEEGTKARKVLMTIDEFEELVNL